MTGSVSLNANDFSELFKSSSTGGMIAPGFNWDILNYGRLANNVNLQRAQFQDLAVQYQQTVLDANAEAETAINTFLKSKERLIYVNKAVAASKESVDLAEIEYRTGAVDYNRVFNLQTSLVADQDNLASVRGDVARSVIATYKALGGGWEIRYGIRRGADASVEQVPVPPSEQAAPVATTIETQEEAKPKVAEPAVQAPQTPKAVTPKADPPAVDPGKAEQLKPPASKDTPPPATGGNASGVSAPRVLLPEVVVEEF